MDEWVVMFVDMVDSTELKYSQTPEMVVDLIKELFALIQADSKGRENIKFTGDGAMIIFEKHNDGCRKALQAAERILQSVDRQNLHFKAPRIHIRIGIATGKCYIVSMIGPDLSGRKVDLAARLCAEAEPDNILVDEDTKQNSGLPAHRFMLCKRRLQLKGVPIPPDTLDKYYHFEPYRFLRPPKEDHYSKGLLALHPDRNSLSRDLRPTRIIYMAAPNSTILVAGRTLIAWTRIFTEMRRTAKEKNVKFYFLVSSEHTSRYLDEQQKVEISNDLPIARTHFFDLVEDDPVHFQFCETEQLILDGITCARILMPGEEKISSQGKLIVLQDINAAPGDAKASLLFACTCNKPDEEGDITCMAHGLYKRTKLIYKESLTSSSIFQ